MAFCKKGQPLFEIGVMGLHRNHATVLVKKYSSSFCFLVNPDFHKSLLAFELESDVSITNVNKSTKFENG